MARRLDQRDRIQAREVARRSPQICLMKMTHRAYGSPCPRSHAKRWSTGRLERLGVRGGRLFQVPTIFAAPLLKPTSKAARPWRVPLARLVDPISGVGMRRTSRAKRPRICLMKIALRPYACTPKKPRERVDSRPDGEEAACSGAVYSKAVRTHGTVEWTLGRGTLFERPGSLARDRRGESRPRPERRSRRNVRHARTPSDPEESASYAGRARG